MINAKTAVIKIAVAIRNNIRFPPLILKAFDTVIIAQNRGIINMLKTTLYGDLMTKL